jgi:hypothetical protein
MKTTKSNVGVAVCASVLMTLAATKSLAEQATPAKADKTYTGTVVSVDPQEHVLNAKGFFSSRKFNLGADCTYTMLDNKTGTMNDLRAGEKVTVSHQDANGVLIADRIVQQPMRYEGMVQAVDPAAHTLTLHVNGADKTFQIAGDCSVMLREDKPGALADIQIGNHVSITYETPDNKLMAREIAQTSIEFTGTLTAIDLEAKTLKARAMFGAKKFNVADNCAIVINGRTDGRLSDLKPTDKFVFSYDEINGVNVVNRIAPAGAQASPVASSSTPPSSGF